MRTISWRVVVATGRAGELRVRCTLSGLAQTPARVASRRKKIAAQENRGARIRLRRTRCTQATYSLVIFTNASERIKLGAMSLVGTKIEMATTANQKSTMSTTPNQPTRAPSMRAPRKKRLRRADAFTPLAGAPSGKCSYCQFDAQTLCAGCERMICSDCIGVTNKVAWLRPAFGDHRSKCANCSDYFRPHVTALHQRIIELEAVVKADKEKIDKLEKSLLDPKVAAEVLADLCGFE